MIEPRRQQLALVVPPREQEILLLVPVPVLVLGLVQELLAPHPRQHVAWDLTMPTKSEQRAVTCHSKLTCPRSGCHIKWRRRLCDKSLSGRECMCGARRWWHRL